MGSILFIFRKVEESTILGFSQFWIIQRSHFLFLLLQIALSACHKPKNHPKAVESADDNNFIVKGVEIGTLMKSIQKCGTEFNEIV